MEMKKHVQQKTQGFPALFRTRKEIAAELGLTDRTFYNRCKEKGLELGRKLLGRKSMFAILIW